MCAGDNYWSTMGKPYYTNLILTYVHSCWALRRTIKWRLIKDRRVFSIVGFVYVFLSVMSYSTENHLPAQPMNPWDIRKDCVLPTPPLDLESLDNSPQLDSNFKPSNSNQSIRTLHVNWWNNPIDVIKKKHGRAWRVQCCGEARQLYWMTRVFWRHFNVDVVTPWSCIISSIEIVDICEYMVRHCLI